MLFSRVFPEWEVGLNRKHSDITIILPEIDDDTVRDKSGNASSTNLSNRKGQGYRWIGYKTGKNKFLKLEAKSAEAVVSGLYALLQEQLGVKFIHPKQTLIAPQKIWPLKDNFSFSGQPLFPNRGFHLHTLHPVELTEQLHNPDYPDAFDDVAAYLDWLARNGQNSFQFFLLRGIDRKAWIPHIKRIVEYAHLRGIRCGVEISISMLQQQAFQVVTLLCPYPPHKKQVEDTLEWLFQIPWDFITVESMTGEHLPLIGKISPGTQRHLEKLVVEQYKRPLLFATHVIGESGGLKVRRPFNPSSGILIHTVMCYSVSEPRAPVYGNKNQRFMLDAAREEIKKRETWYWPESSYWVAFDSSVPLFLLPYLESRWNDINTMHELRLDGHLTFSTGWEWGYWLVDWSIARWSWLYSYNGKSIKNSPTSTMAEIFKDPVMARDWKRALDVQNHFLKELELIRYMSASTPFAEFPLPLSRPFQPAPCFSYRWLLKKATPEKVQEILKGPVTDLERYASSMHVIIGRLERRACLLQTKKNNNQELKQLSDELITALKVSALRAEHRALTLRAIASKRRGGAAYKGRFGDFNQYLSKARELRWQAMILVREREAYYRYPVELLAGKRQSLTAYPFGYLYTTGNLFFWEREEEQARSERFDPFFMNIWDIRKTIGFESLFFK